METMENTTYFLISELIKTGHDAMLKRIASNLDKRYYEDAEQLMVIETYFEVKDKLLDDLHDKARCLSLENQWRTVYADREFFRAECECMASQDRLEMQNIIIYINE